MNREEVIALAREANISVFEDNTFADDMYISVLYRFANLVEERTLTNQKARYYQEGYDAGVHDERNRIKEEQKRCYVARGEQ